MQLVNNIAINPSIAVELKLLQDDELDHEVDDPDDEIDKQILEHQLSKQKSNQKKASIVTTNEAQQLQESILKIGKMLYLVYGQAGNLIITNSVTNRLQLEHSMGEKMYAFYGFCDIRNFTDVTEVLEEDVMLFVNEIAHLVHSEVDLLCGAANKNIGDAF